MRATIAVLPGDGVGPEVIAAGCAVLRAVGERFGHEFELDELLVGGAALDVTGDPLPDDTLAGCRGSQAVLLGAVGGPKWDDPAAKIRPEQGLLRLRKELGLFANLRPVRAYPALHAASPLKSDRLDGVDLVVVRELTGGLYFGEPRLREQTADGARAVDTLVYSEGEIRRILRLAFEMARGRRKHVTSVDKANVLESSRLWRELATQLGRDYPDVALSHQLVDSAAMRLVTSPASFDVIVTENMFGDILSDEASVISGSLGLLGSASLGETQLGLYEPIHGSAPDIAGRGVANPLGTIASIALLLRYSLGLSAEAAAVERAIELTLESGPLTPDLGGQADTLGLAAAVAQRLS